VGDSVEVERPACSVLMPVINRAMSLRVWFGNLSIARIASSAHAVFSLKPKITLGSPRLALKVGR
jgi:hypothetical protein